MLTLTLSKELTREPFKTLFLSQIESIEQDTLGAKTEFIQHLVDSLSTLENDTENETTLLHWTGVFTGFSTAATIAGIGTLNPVLAFFVGTISAVSALSTVGLSFAQNHKMAPILETLRRSRIALNSDEAINWAAIWHIGGVNCFIGAVKAAMSGTLSNDGTRLLRLDNKTPITVGVDYLARRYGLTREQAVDEIKKVKAGNPSKLPSLEPVSILALPEDKPKDKVLGGGQPTKLQTEAPTVLQTSAPTVIQSSDTPSFMAPLPNDSIDKTVMYQNALSALDFLVDKADQGVKGGCVILAAPGAGKTTFLGAAWGRLQQKFGSRFRSLAIVVKRTDVQAFNGVSDACICARTNPREAAVAIIQFVDASMEPTGDVRRLFLDDFLTMEKIFAGLGGKYINPNTYRIYNDRKFANLDVDALPLLQLLLTRLNEAWLVGRQYNFSLYVSSHSSNVEALPFIGSKEARAVGDFIFLAKNDKRDFIEHALSNHHLIGDAGKRASLKLELDNQIDVGDEPLILSNYNNWTLGIVPAAVDEEYKKYRAIWERAISNNTKVLEAMFQAEPYKTDLESSATTAEVNEPTNAKDNVSLEVPDYEDNDEEELTDNANKVLDWLLEKGTNTWIKYKGKHDRDMNFVKFLSNHQIKMEERDSIILGLIRARKIELSPDGAYIRAL